ncbi:MAG: Signal peptidase I (EC [uncultured Aureispira sp.]|uniref:Signal peptidase I n=1 Tax=uncultured Aureispira sp. TaxID=1331704 RepID=A0A6S6TMT2_9BACT|nr:MAG: Signal peptidase I (EC [uncultured Aureispira sp.]
MSWLLYTIVGLYWIPFVGMYKLFEKAGEPSWAALVPFYNAFVLVKIIGGPKWWLLAMLLPVVNLFIIAGMLIEFNKSFGQYKFADNFAAIVLPYVYYPYLSSKKVEYVHQAWAVQDDIRKRFKAAVKADSKSEMRRLEKENPFPKKSKGREWSESIIFAVFAAHFIRLFLIEAYTIPTPSMEGSLLVGDFLFVSKVHYGSRMPMTPLAFPLIHNMLPFSGGESYSNAVDWDYRRAPKIQNVERYDPVVFNYPEDDTAVGGLESDGQPFSYPMQYHNQLKRVAPNERQALRQKLKINYADRLVYRPVDKRTHYIKRCVGIPGDKIQVKEGVLYVNDKESEVIDGVQYRYKLLFTEAMNPIALEDKYPITFELKGYDGRGNRVVDRNIAYVSPAVATEIVAKESTVESMTRDLLPKGVYRNAFPYNKKRFNWNIDNYGPITIPKRGNTIDLSLDNIELYTRLIAAYEGNKLEVKGGKIYINGEVATTYTPQLDYYWMMGDNRNNSADSRAWGFVPEDHVVGKPLFVWLSLKNGSLRGPNGGVRWERFFMGASGR